MSGHTPGPWEHSGHNLVDATSIHNGMKYCVAKAVITGKSDSDKEEAYANARLIAAAPDLLKIARFLVEWDEAGGDMVSLGALSSDDDETTLRMMARAAIDKAEGKE